MIDPGTLKWMLEQTDEKLVDVLFSAGRIPYSEKAYWLELMPALRAARPEAMAQEAKRYRAWRDGDVIVRRSPSDGWEARHESTPHWDVASWHWSESLDEAMDKALSEPTMNSGPT